MKVGDILVDKDNIGRLCCGSGIYPYAICVSIEPFAMVSEEGDMLWRCQESHNFTSRGPAPDPEICKAAFDRYERETGKRPVFGEGLT